MICDGLSARLNSVAQFVRQGATFADIGTDHAYLPIFLLKEGRISHAYCSDINEGPLATARRNAEDAGLEGKITFTLADGAAALADKGITDYAVCGMGGELIADIISRAPHLKDDTVSLILQPMTRQAHLRRYLAASGFTVTAESYSRDGGKNYVCMLARYTGVCREIDNIEAEFGNENCEIVNICAQISYLKEKNRALSQIAEGKIRGGKISPPELALAREGELRLKSLEKLLLS